ncbi:MAG: OapB/ArvB family protein [Candidatus Pacearchaeota archaeon]
MKKNSKLKGLSIHIMPYSEIRELTITERVKKILNLILGNRVVILQGRLRPEEEIRLIEDTMAMVDHIKTFKGIELAVVEANRDEGFFLRMKRGIARGLTGESNSLTVIGPASIVKEIKRDPSKIEVFF